MEQIKKSEVKEEKKEKTDNMGKTPTSEHLAMEILKQEQDKHRARNRGLFAGMIILAIVTGTVAVAGAIERAHLIDVNYQNDCEWRTLFSDYDFISQDGEGINNANYGEQGDLNNGAENKVKKESGEQ